MQANLLGNAQVDVSDPIRAAVNQRRISLQQGGAGGDALPRLLRRLDAADADQRQLAADVAVQQPQHLQRAGGDGRAGDAAGTHLLHDRRRGLQALARNGRVRGHDAGQAQLHGQVGDGEDVLVGQIRRDFHQHRRRRLLLHRRENRTKSLHGLQVAKARSVGRRDVDHHVVGQIAELAGGIAVIVDGALQRHDLGLAQVDADDAVAAPVAEVDRHQVRAGVVEAHAVQQRTIVLEPEQARLRVARLGKRGDGAQLGVPEADVRPAIRGGGGLVEARRQPQGTGEIHAEHGLTQHRIVDDQQPRDRPAHLRGALQASQPIVHHHVDALRRELEHRLQGSLIRGGADGVRHGCSSGASVNGGVKREITRPRRRRWASGPRARGAPSGRARPPGRSCPPPAPHRRRPRRGTGRRLRTRSTRPGRRPR